MSCFLLSWEKIWLYPLILDTTVSIGEDFIYHWERCEVMLEILFYFLSFSRLMKDYTGPLDSYVYLWWVLLGFDLSLCILSISCFK